MFGTLALEDAVNVRVSIAQRDAGGMGRRKSQTLDEPEKLSSLSETKKICQTSLDVKKKLKYLVLQEFN